MEGGNPLPTAEWFETSRRTGPPDPQGHATDANQPVTGVGSSRDRKAPRDGRNTAAGGIFADGERKGPETCHHGCMAVGAIVSGEPRHAPYLKSLSSTHRHFS